MSCNQCGMCCKTIVLDFTIDDLKTKGGDDAKFIIDNWKPISTNEAITINPFMKHWIKRYVKHNAPYHFYTCTLLDTKNGCTIHNQNKPHICTGFPFYNRPVKKTLLYSPNCGYFKEIQEVEQNEKYRRNVKTKG